MFIPDHFKLGGVAEHHALMRAYPFAALITTSDAGYEVTHLPTVLKSEGELGLIECHVSRANPHWRTIATSGRGLLIYTGPQAYITPGWYPSKAAHGKAVPTWNYAVVHAHGTAEIVDDRDWLVRHVSELTDQQEAGTPNRGRRATRRATTSTSCRAASSGCVSRSGGSKARPR